MNDISNCSELDVLMLGRVELFSSGLCLLVGISETLCSNSKEDIEIHAILRMVQYVPSLL